MDLATLMTLEPYGADGWLGTGPNYPWGGLYGGQIVAQGLRAAAATVDPSFRPHSLHASFLRSGADGEETLYEVDRVRDGRSFCNRTVIARQAAGRILTMTASFHIDEPSAEVQVVGRPPVPHPDDLPASRWSPFFDRRIAPSSAPGTVIAWMRVDEALPDDLVEHACALAYETDDLPTDAVVALHPDRGRDDEFHGRFFSASLDHTVWFHRPLRVDEWHLHAFECHGLTGSRGVAIGHVFDGDGVHAATVSQEIVIRSKR
ncbi:MAG TPA: acyl-CoA thioesterase domain-containing protein [Acidimicrobiales bacterium]|nr:acyl-CoA thioesterase domain-containing protein [Acidimicrobiales bacterium]